MESDYDVYIGRPGPWGNIYSHRPSKALAMGRPVTLVATQQEAVDRFRDWFIKQPLLIRAAREILTGKVLGCWCRGFWTPDAPCHGDVYLEVCSEESPAL